MEALVKTGGFLMIFAAGVQALMLFLRVGMRRFRARRLDREFLKLLRELAVNEPESKGTPGDGTAPAWQGKRKFQIVWREYETPGEDICSFYLVPCDQKPIPMFRPGRFLTFELNIPGRKEPITRCYSLSDSPTQRRYYRITIKHMKRPPNAPDGAPDGLSSSHFHENMEVGNIIEAFAPAGSFHLDQGSSRPVVLIAGGVGITPLLSMLNWMAASGSKREIWLFYGVTSRSDHAMYEHFHALRQRMTNFRMVTFYAKPTRTCRLGIDYDVEGFVSVDHMRKVLTARNYEFYVCGPPPMMKKITEDLRTWGVPDQDVLTESFGGSAKPGAAKASAAEKRDMPADEVRKRLAITFAKSNKTVAWNRGSGSLLELAEESGIKARFACRAGNCGTCATVLAQGEVAYDEAPLKTPDPGSCLLCVARPKTNLVLDL